MAIFKKIDSNEFYLFMNGKLIYKRWFSMGYSKVFDIMAYDKHTLVSITDDKLVKGSGPDEVSENECK
ncbi:hypothetical protein D3C80_1184510 [compost metagenome]